MLEIEIKLPIENDEAVREALSGMGFEAAGEYRERDLYFDSASHQIRNGGQALRVRENINLETCEEYSEINFKDRKLDDRTMSRRELETVVADAGVVTEILKSLGYNPVEPYVSKTRALYRSSDMNACIDEVEGLGTFLELEIVAEAPEGRDEQEIRREGLAKIETVLGMLGYSMDDTINVSYLGLLIRETY